MHNRNPESNYDVFLSSKGGDTDEEPFASHLYTSLQKAGISVLWDDDGMLSRDEQISPSVVQAIQRCRISVVVLSEAYAGSRRCLEVLEQIIECRRVAGQFVLPVFLGISREDVLYQRSGFGYAFDDLTSRISDKDKVESWKLSFARICQIQDFIRVPSISRIVDEHERRWKERDEDIKNVTEHVTHSLDMFVVDQPVGLKARVQDVIQLLNSKMLKDVLLLGIWGMVGSGKTTLAKAIYNILSPKYEGRSFLQDISDIWKQDNGRVCLQEKLLSDINTTTNVKKDDMKAGKSILCERLYHERILLVLDGVDDLEQLNALCGSRECFGSDSIIIITTRDKRLLNELGVDHVYRMKEMDESESAMLLSWHAFKQPSPREDFVGLCRDVVAHCGGLPLALEVLGCELFGKDESEWKSLMHRYKRIPHPIIQNVLKRSFDGLADDRVKNVFLKIACFFVGLDQNEVTKKLNGFEDHLAARSVPVLVEQSLVIVDEMNRLRVHVLLQHMAREIFRQRSGMPSIYDVFFSFSIGTPSSFTSCLIGSLEKAGISVFWDDDGVLTGDDHISPSLVQVIQRCRISVVVLSKGYVGSRRCLEVLEQIIECSRFAGQFVLPVLFGISDYELDYQNNVLVEAFRDLTTRISNKDKVESWKIALARMSMGYQNVSYYMFDHWSDNDEDIKKIVELATGLLDRTDLFVADYPVGVESRVQEVCQPLIHQRAKGVLLLGLWGMAGIGKTTIAKAIYNEIGGNFEGRSFLPNIREVWEQDGRHVYLQELLLSDVYKLPVIKIDSIRIGKMILKNKLSHKRVLLVLDDVNKLEQLDALCGSREWFGPGSVIIITTRDRSLLRALQVDHVYRIKEMDERESLRLLDKWSFGYEFISNDEKKNLVASVGGLPLSLEVEILASVTFDRFKEFPHTFVQKAIKTSISDLNDTEKDLFFDIACFLNGMDHEEETGALNTFKLARDGMRALEDRGFVSIDENNRLKMHVILRDVGRKIIHEQTKMDPGSWIYDVFLSFRGNDTRKLLSALYASLANAGIHVFKDDNELGAGGQILISHLQAIRRSRISIVVLSRHYAGSRWCLQELEYIMECRRTIGQVVLPIFYDVNPSSVCNQTHMFGEAFQDLLKKSSVEKDKEKEKSWRTALHDIGSIAGIEMTKFRDNNQGINQIVEYITRWLDKSTFVVAEHPVGLESRVQSVIKLLHYQRSKDVQLLGISGIGGIGKTTIAKAIYNQIRHDFDGSCFLLDIREFWKEMTSRLHFQEQILFDVLKKRERIKNIESGKNILRERLHHKRVLLILDNVDELDQLEALCWSREWFGSGSRIIITTRDERLLRVLEVDHKYRMLEMNNHESVEHFSWHAFKQASPEEDFVGLCRDVVAHCGGLPLALEVLGCELFGRDESEWKSLMQRYKRIPHPIIQNVLKRSFDGLGDDSVKNVFLEIACFFVGLDQDEVIQKLNGFGLHLAATSVPVLVEQSLVIVDEMNRLRVHVLLQHMAREIFRQRSEMPSIYDVFFSFSIDTPSSFTSCLTGSLEKAGISVFRDDDSLTGGDHISPSVVQVIQRCRISVVVLSEGYTGSRRCLEVLEQIIECSRIAGQFVLPVFFGISRYDLCYQERGFGEAFGDLTKRISDKDKVESWKIALARIFSCHLDVSYNMFHYWSDNDEDIKKIVELATGLLDGTDLFVAEYPVGVESRVQEVCQPLIHQKAKGVLLLGLWGMAGIGKTTIAKAIYNEIGGNFEGRSFLPNIREVWEQDRRHVYLQELLLSDVYKLPVIKIDSIGIGKMKLKNKLSHKRVLLVLDDVNKLEQLDALCGSREWFGPGSVIIITTRDRSLLRALQVDHVYRIKEMDKRESLQLLYNWSSRSKFLSNDEKQNLVASVGGLPLALEVEVLASGTFDRFKEFPHTVVQKAIETCINDLSDTEKDLFFDIACFLNGMDHEEETGALNTFKLASDGMRALEDRCFVSIDENNRLKMHVILRDVGRKIIHEQTKMEPGSWIYDVFLSFRGEDTHKLLSSLYASLANAGIHVFKDDNKLRAGGQILISLLQAIRRSRISIVVLSRHYAGSRWCLQELEYIMECRRTIGQVVLPIFYDVDPSSVRNQTRMFGEAFQDLLKKFSVEKDEEKEKSWRTALHDIGSIEGIEMTKFRDNNQGINQIVEYITRWLDKSTFVVAEHPVGLESRVQSVIKLLHYQQSKDVQLLGISGIGGIGKTTIAKAIYNQIRYDFDGSCFLQDIREFWKEMSSRLHLQEQILFDVLKKRERINNIESGKNILRERLHHKRVLLILDNVDELDQLEALCWSREWFGSGSRIIITTRDERLLRVLEVDHKYRMLEMNNHESVEHFSWHAFKQASPEEDFVGLCRDVVAHCGGLPLALEVLGCELYGKDESEWKSLMHRYKRTPHPTIQNVLKRSFDGLGDDGVKNVFLEVACFFVGLDQNEVIQKLNGFGDHLAATSVPVLVEQSLVIVDEMNRLGMHVLLQHMAREIFRQRSGMPSIYDVFFSFSIDTPSSFTSYFIGSLEKAGISVFKNDNLFTGGDHISPSVVQVIQRCRISVVVLSEGYTGSRRCLEVLEQIIECSRIAGQFVLPVFFGIPRSHLNYWRSEFGKDFGDLTKRISDKDKVESWKIALARIAMGHHDVSYEMSDYWSDDDEDIKKIVELATGLLDGTDLFVAEYPVGVESRVQEVCQPLIHQKAKGVLLLGVWGMAGVGKTTIAKAIYNEIGGNFEGRSFLPNIREVWEQDRRHVYLQERLLSDVYKLPKIEIDNIRIGIRILQKKLSHKKVLLVLDDVNKLEQLDALCGSREWFGPGSVIIITTRDRSLLREIQVDHVHRIKEMDECESLQLLDEWSSGSKFLSSDEKQTLVASVGGLPLALEVAFLATFKEFPHTIVEKAIKTCINDLNDTEKCIFFDIACFLHGMDHKEAMEALNAFKLASNGMSVLEDRCFVTIDEKNRLKMHLILRDVGRKIIHEQTKVEPGSWIYDVFLSFRGEDTRQIFSSPLHASLENAGIQVFKDDNELRMGDWISISLLQAIRRSRISVVVLSRHYANSRWCLQELKYIMECRRTIDQVVLPVFYDVHPKEVRNQTSMFGEALKDLLKKFSVEEDNEKENSWRTALHDIGNIVGIEIIKFRDKNEGINKIVEDIVWRLDKSTFIVAEHPVGLESRVQSVIKLLQQSEDVQLLGISGIGGIGKTTIAKAIYNQIRHDFDGSCFLLDIREFWKDMTSQLHLQEQILFDALKKRERINNIESGKNILRERLRHKKVLLILDDVDKSDQLKALCWSREGFGPGSRIIITTRDDGLLKVLGVDHKYKMSEMDKDESIEHFSWHAFKQASPKEDFAELSRDVVAYCGGLPLALEVIGSLLFDEIAKIWQSVLEKLKTIPNEEVQKKLRVSFDGLGDETERKVFLDIAFFFIGMDRNDVIHILDGYHPEVGISNLIARNLVSVDKNNKLRMHDLLRDMGRQIVREESLEEPEKRSRLWLQEDVLEVFQNHHAGIDYSVEGLTLKSTETHPICLKTEAFRKMRRLRLLQFAGVQLDGDFVCHDSCKLRWLYWHGYPLDYLTYFNGGSLVALELESSNLVLMSNETQIFEKLKVLNLSHSHRLTQTPDFSCLPNLEKLLLKDCPSLSAVSATIGDLKNILLINFEKCTRLPNLPRSFYKLKSLDTLIISGCSMIDKLEEDVEQMESLITLLADKTGIKQVPFSMVRSKSIGYISMCGYEGFSRDVFPSLIWSWMSPTNVVSFSSLVQSSYMGLELVSLSVPKFLSLRVRCGSDHKQGIKKILDILDAAYCKILEATTTSPVSNLKSSSLIDFPCQFHISGSAKFVLIEVGMKSQVTNDLREMILQKLTTSGPDDDCLLPSDNWFTFNCDDSSVIFEVPRMDGCILKSMTLCNVYSSSPDTIISECLETVSIQNHTQSTTRASSEDGEWQIIMSSLKPGDIVEIGAVSGDGFIVKKTTVYLIFDAPTDQNMEQQMDVIVSRDNDTVIGGDENIFDRFFKLPSLAHDVLKTRPFCSSLVILVSIISAILARKKVQPHFK